MADKKLHNEETVEEGKTFKDRHDHYDSKRKDNFKKAIKKNMELRNSRQKRVVDDKAMSEEVEDITELKALNRRNLKGYIKKAAKNAIGHSEHAGRITHLIHKKVFGPLMHRLADKARNKASNRIHGIEQATKKLDKHASTVKKPVEKKKAVPKAKPVEVKSSKPKHPPKMSMPVVKAKEVPKPKVQPKAKAPAAKSNVVKFAPKKTSRGPLAPHEKDDRKVLHALGNYPSTAKAPIKKAKSKVTTVKVAAEETINELSPAILNNYMKKAVQSYKDGGENRESNFNLALGKSRKFNGLPSSTKVKIAAKIPKKQLN